MLDTHHHKDLGSMLKLMLPPHANALGGEILLLNCPYLTGTGTFVVY